MFRFWHQSWIILSVVGVFGLCRLTLGWRLLEMRLSEVPWLQQRALLAASHPESGMGRAATR